MTNFDKSRIVIRWVDAKGASHAESFPAGEAGRVAAGQKVSALVNERLEPERLEFDEKGRPVPPTTQ
jgi:hypothetical protein